MTTAARISKRMAAASLPRTRPEAIYAVVMDDHNVHCMTEDMLDTWWAGLAPEQKGEIYERDLDGDIGPSVSLHGELGTFAQTVNAFQKQFQRTLAKPLAVEVRRG